MPVETCRRLQRSGKASQAPALLPFLCLNPAFVVPECHWCVQGYAGLHEAQHCKSQEESQQAVQAAVSHLFQAAAVFHSASHPTQYGQQADLATSCTLVTQVVHHILTSLTGTCDIAPQQVCPPDCFGDNLLLRTAS